MVSLNIFVNTSVREENGLKTVRLFFRAVFVSMRPMLVLNQDCPVCAWNSPNQYRNVARITSGSGLLIGVAFPGEGRFQACHFLSYSAAGKTRKQGCRGRRNQVMILTRSGSAMVVKPSSGDSLRGEL